MSGPLKVPGAEVEIAGVTYVVPALNAAAVKQHQDIISMGLAQATPDLQAVVTLLYAALRRNYPEIPRELLEDWVDYRNVVNVLDIIMHTSGLAVDMGNLLRRTQTGMLSSAQNPSTT